MYAGEIPLRPIGRSATNFSIDNARLTKDNHNRNELDFMPKMRETILSRIMSDHPKCMVEYLPSIVTYTKSIKP